MGMVIVKDFILDIIFLLVRAVIYLVFFNWSIIRFCGYSGIYLKVYFYIVKISGED